MKSGRMNFLKKEWRRELNIFKNEPLKLALSFGIGVFIGFTPTVGFQTILCYLISKIFKISFIASFIGSSIPTGIPWLIPFLYYGCYRVGEFLTGIYPHFTISDFRGIGSFVSLSIINFGKPLIAGCLFCGVIGGYLSFFVVYRMLLKRNENK